MRPTITFSGSYGSFEVDAGTGVAVRHWPDRDDPFNPASDPAEGFGYRDLVRVDLAERRAWYAAHGVTLPEPQPDGDVLDVGAWFATTGHCEPATDWRAERILPGYAAAVVSPEAAQALCDLPDDAATFAHHVRRVGYASQDLNEAAAAMARLLPDAMRERLSFDAVAERLAGIRDRLASFLLDTCGDDEPWESFPEIDAARLDMDRRARGEPAELAA